MTDIVPHCMLPSCCAQERLFHGQSMSKLHLTTCYSRSSHLATYPTLCRFLRIALKVLSWSQHCMSASRCACCPQQYIAEVLLLCHAPMSVHLTHGMNVCVQVANLALPRTQIESWRLSSWTPIASTPPTSLQDLEFCRSCAARRLAALKG